MRQLTAVEWKRGGRRLRTGSRAVHRSTHSLLLSRLARTSEKRWLEHFLKSFLKLIKSGRMNLAPSVKRVGGKEIIRLTESKLISEENLCELQMPRERAAALVESEMRVDGGRTGRKRPRPEESY